MYGKRKSRLWDLVKFVIKLRRQGTTIYIVTVRKILAAKGYKSIKEKR